MTEFLFLGGILLLRVFQKISSKTISNEMPRDSRGLSAYISLKFAISAGAALILLLIAEAPLAAITSLPPLGWLISCATGVTLTISSICSLFAMHGSSIVLGALFGMAGLLVPTISGIFIFGQEVSLFQWGGMVCLFVSALLLASSSQKTNGKLTVKTLLLLFGSMLSNGSTMLLQTLYKAYVPQGSVSLYSFLQFAIPSVVLIIFFAFKSIQKPRTPVHFSKKLLIFTIITAVALFGISQISTIASATIPVAVLFPISDGGGAVISAIVAAVVYKEKLTVKSVIGIALGILGVCVMKLL